jgi:hypothetical protein
MTLTVLLTGRYRKTKKGGLAKFWSGARPNNTSRKNKLGGFGTLAHG